MELIKSEIQLQNELNQEKSIIKDKLNNSELKPPGLMDMLFNEIKKQVGNIIDEFQLTYNDQIQFIKYTCNEGFRLFDKIFNESDSDNLLNLKNKFNNFISLLNDEIRELFFMVLEIIHLKDLMNIFKSIYNVGEFIFSSKIKKIKLIDELSDNVNISNPMWNKLKTFLKEIIPSLDKLLMLLGIYLINLATYRDIGNDNINNDIPNNISSIGDSSIIINNSLTNNDPSIINSDTLDSTNMDSICPIPNIINDLNPLLNNSCNPNKAYIEIDKSNQFSFNVSLNQDVSTNNILGYIGGIPIKSHISGKITEIHDNYIKIENFIEYNVGFDKANEIISNFESLNYLEDFLLSYQIKTLLPKITDNKLSKNTNFWSVKNLKLKLNYDIFNSIIDRSNDLINQYYDNIKNLNTDGNIKSICENDNSDKYLDDLVNIKKNFFNSLFTLYNSSIEYSRTLDDNSDYKLYTYYLDMYSNLDGSTNNKYILNFKSILNNILLNRYTSDNINIYDLKNQINEICNSTFKSNNYDYYNDIEKKFINSDFDYKSIYDYLESFNLNNVENITSNINKVINLFEYIKNIYKNELVTNSNNKNVNVSDDYVLNLTKDEITTINSFISNLINEYYDLFDKCYNHNYNDEIEWPGSSIIINNNEPYYYYRFNTNNIEYDNADDLYSGTTNVEINNIKYWKKYCSLATLLSIPYMSTGIIIAGAPILLPIVYIPITIINLKSMIIVIGLGICGIAIYPMVLYVNLTSEYATIVVATMMALDALRQTFEDDVNNQNNNISIIVNSIINELNNENNDIDLQIHEINKQIDDIKNGDNFDELKRKIKEIKNESKRSKGIRLKNK